MSDRVKVPKRERHYFNCRVRHWQLILGLTDWDIALGDDAMDGDVATVSYKRRARCARIGLAKELPAEELAHNRLDFHALHECLHLLLVPVTQCADALQDAGMLAQDILEAEHRIIQTLTPLLQISLAKR